MPKFNTLRDLYNHLKKTEKSKVAKGNHTVWVNHELGTLENILKYNKWYRGKLAKLSKDPGYLLFQTYTKVKKDWENPTVDLRATILNSENWLKTTVKPSADLKLYRNAKINTVGDYEQYYAKNNQTTSAIK